MEGLKRLYEQKASLIYKYLIKRGASREDAEEIVQSTFLKAIEYEMHLMENSLAWLFKVALNQFYDICRKNQRHPGLVLDEEILVKELREVGVEEQILQGELGKSVRDQLLGLSETYRNLLLLKYEMDLSYEEIGRLLGMKPEKVKTYLYRARNEFKEKWRKP